MTLYDPTRGIDKRDIDWGRHEPRVHRTAAWKHQDARASRFVQRGACNQPPRALPIRHRLFNIPIPAKLAQSPSGNRAPRHISPGAHRARCDSWSAAPSSPDLRSRHSASIAHTAALAQHANSPTSQKSKTPHSITSSSSHPMCRRNIRLHGQSHIPNRKTPYITTPGLHGSTVMDLVCANSKGAPISTPATTKPWGHGAYRIVQR